MEREEEAGGGAGQFFVSPANQKREIGIAIPVSSSSAALAA